MLSDRWAGIAALLGLLLIAASFVWPQVANRGPGAWTDEKAEQHAKTRAELHAASHDAAPGHDHGDGHDHGEGNPARLRELQERFEAELAQLDAARNRGEFGARVLWWSGALLAGAGAGGYFLQRAR